MAFLSCIFALHLNLFSCSQSVSLPSWLSYLFILFRNAVHCVTGLRLIACQFQLWHIREANPPLSPLFSNRRETLKSWQCAPFFFLPLSLILHSLIKCFTHKKSFFMYYGGRLLITPWPNATAQNVSVKENTETPSWHGLFGRRVATLQAIDKNYCSLLSEILRPFIFLPV